jgi:acetate---CoA ligase (ADP-forming) subunit beta
LLKQEIEEITRRWRPHGWVVEPEAKRILSLAGVSVPRYIWAGGLQEAVDFGKEIGYPLAVKVVSPEVMHKSDVGGVRTGIGNERELEEAYRKMSGLPAFQGILVEEMLPAGIELILGAKVDYQFGPVVLVGMGGTGVEIYHDAELRMAPLEPKDPDSMIRALKAYPLLQGYRGSEPVDLPELKRTLMAFSSLVMELETKMESMDINPLICSRSGCIAADARIILQAPPQ